MNKRTKRRLFRSWFNDFLTVERFAEYYGLEVIDAKSVISEGRVLHEEFAEKFKSKVKNLATKSK
jgi:hypothetical protein